MMVHSKFIIDYHIQLIARIIYSPLKFVIGNYLWLKRILEQDQFLRTDTREFRYFSKRSSLLRKSAFKIEALNTIRTSISLKHNRLQATYPRSGNYLGSLAWYVINLKTCNKDRQPCNVNCFIFGFFFRCALFFMAWRSTDFRDLNTPHKDKVCLIFFLRRCSSSNWLAL